MTPRPRRTAPKRKGARPLAVTILGAGKVGSGLARALREAGADVTLRAARRGVPSQPVRGDLLVLAVRDGQLAPLVEKLVRAGAVSSRTAVVHCAGALGPEPLFPLRTIAAGVAQMHPMISFASLRKAPTLARGHMHIDGDRAASRAAKRVARLLGMTPRTIPDLDRVAYHAAAGWVANGSCVLAATGSDLLEKAGVSRAVAAQMLGPLLRSVADNVERLGFPAALTGPVRRGDARGVGRHLEIIRSRAPDLVDLYRGLVAAQLPLARELGEADPGDLDRIAEAVSEPEPPARAPRTAP